MLLTLQIVLGVFLGEVLFALTTTLVLSYRRRNQRSELEGLLSQLQGLGEETDENAEQLVGV